MHVTQRKKLSITVFVPVVGRSGVDMLWIVKADAATPAILATRVFGFPTGELMMLINSKSIKSGSRYFREYYVDKTDYCHIWKGFTNNNDGSRKEEEKGEGAYTYGEFDLRSCDTLLVHRQPFYILTGDQIPKNLDAIPVVCGNHLCVNPKHLGVVESNYRKKDRWERATPMLEFIKMWKVDKTIAVETVLARTKD